MHHKQHMHHLHTSTHLFSHIQHHLRCSGQVTWPFYPHIRKAALAISGKVTPRAEWPLLTKSPIMWKCWMILYFFCCEYNSVSEYLTKCRLLAGANTYIFCDCLPKVCTHSFLISGVAGHSRFMFNLVCFWHDYIDNTQMTENVTMLKFSWAYVAQSLKLLQFMIMEAS